MDTKLRAVLRDYGRGECARDSVLLVLARAGVSPASLSAGAEDGLRWAFVDQLDYCSFVRLPRDEAAADNVALFRAARAGGFGTVVVTVWAPTWDELVEGADDLRFVVGADARSRCEVIETVSEAFPCAVVCSAQVADGKRPPRVLSVSPPVEAAWPEESKRVHVRG